MKIAIIARHFPPAISGGSRRPQVLCETLHALGHETFVVAPKLNDDVHGLAVPHPAEDACPADGVIRAPTQNDPVWRVWQRDLALWPDPDRWWANQVVEQATDALKAFAPELIITTSPPESVHHVGYSFSQSLGCQWIADFRDSWLDTPLMPARHKLYRRIGESWQAKRWLRSVDLAIAPTRHILDELRGYAPALRTHLYPQLSLPPKARQGLIAGWDNLPRGMVRMLHTGSFSLSDPNRTLAPVLDMVTQWDAPNLVLCLAGRFSAEEVQQIEAKAQLRWLGCVSADEARALQCEADALLLVATEHTHAVPGKLSEYRQARRPILVLGDGPWSSAASIPNRIELNELSKLSGAHDAWNTMNATTQAGRSNALVEAKEATQTLLMRLKAPD